jgi:hypothetical protein
LPVPVRETVVMTGVNPAGPVNVKVRLPVM